MTTIRPTALRPVTSKADEHNAFDLFYAAMYDDPDAFMALIPDTAEPKPVAIAEDGSSAEFEIYAWDGASWEPTNGPPVARVLVERSGETPNTDSLQ